MLIHLALQVQPGNPVEVLTRISLVNILYAFLILAAAYALARLSDALLEAMALQAPRARFFIKLTAPTIRFALWLTAGYVIISIFAPSSETQIALLASVGIALGLGAQDLIKNIIGGLVILADRPYQLGDRVRIGDAYGEIDHIGLRSTKLTTPDDTRVTIPNSEILTGKAWNANSGVPDCQVVTVLYLPHDTNPSEALEIAREAAFSSPYLLLSKPVTVLLQDQFHHGPYLQVRVKGYVFDHRYEPRLQSDITLRAKVGFRKRGLLGYGKKQIEEIAEAAEQ